MSRATEGFSVITSVLDTRNTIATGLTDSCTRKCRARYSFGVPTPFYTFVGAASWPLMRGVFRLHAAGVDNVPAGGVVIGANHTSNFDPWPLAFPLWPHRQLYFMAKSELFNPLLGPPLRAGGAFPVRRGEQDVEAIEAAVELCREGKIVAMFPEGTRRVKGVRKKFTARPHIGAARVGLAAEVPIVPAAVLGTDRLARLPRLGVAYGPPIPVDDLAGLPPRDAATAATERLMTSIETLLDGLE
jgi:1-acyl-sn-glycerol-3-phosphate acyltransferase